MADTTVTPIQLVENVMSADSPIAGATAIVAANTFKIPFPREGRLLLVLNNTFAGAKVFTIKAGSDAFIASSVGDLALSLAQDDVRFIMVTSDRFKQSDGYVNITFESGTTGFVQAIALPMTV